MGSQSEGSVVVLLIGVLTVQDLSALAAILAALEAWTWTKAAAYLRE